MNLCILAAGQGKRMKSKTSKLLHPVCGKPLISHVIAAASELKPESIGLVIGHQRDQIQQALEGVPVEFVVQEEQLGTGHAVGEFLRHKPGLKGQVVVISGDTPLLTAGLLRSLLEEHRSRRASVSVVTTEVENASGYGRVIRGSTGLLERIVEEADATAQQKEIREINAGLYVFDADELRAWLPRVGAENRQKEYYLPDVIEMALVEKRVVLPFRAPAAEVLGVNTRVDLAAVNREMRRRINEHWMLEGVTLHDPETTYIDSDVRIGADTILYPNVLLEGTTVIGSDVVIHMNCRIRNSKIDAGCVVLENSSVDSARMETKVQVGPFARVRPDTVLRKGARIGNFVELKKTTMGEGSKANHLSYLGDATIGARVNIGAGTITCNYDGVHKHPTVIDDDVFIGSDTQLIAPVKVGKGAYVAAGSSITDDVPPDSLAIARGRQVNKEGWVKKKK